MKPLFYKFWTNIKDSFWGWNFIYYLLAFALTYIIVTSGFDWKYFQFFTGSLLSNVLFSAALVGFLFPFLVPIGFLIFGKIRKNISLLNTGFALGQAAIVGYLLSTFLKVFTGRVGPPLNHLSNTILLDTSRIFQFGFLRGGIFWGWPSTHTTVAFAMALTMCVLYSKNKTIKILAILYALYIGFGVSMTIHWFSDFIAGAIIGTVIGIVVGKAFRKRIS